MAKGDGRGGARPGAGRPRKAEKFAGQIAAAEDLIGKDRLPHLIGNLLKLAGGGYQRVKEEWEPAGSIMREAQAEVPELDDARRPVLGPDGRPVMKPLFNTFTGAPIMTKVPAFPDLDPGTMVCVSRTTETAECDRAANEYLINRILGRPTQAVELSGPDGEQLSVTFESAILSAYGPAAGESSVPLEDEPDSG